MTSISFKGGEISGRIAPPPSKSHTHRAFFLASLARGESRIANALLSADTRATLAACRAMGAEIAEDGDGFRISEGGCMRPRRWMRTTPGPPCASSRDCPRCSIRL